MSILRGAGAQSWIITSPLHLVIGGDRQGRRSNRRSARAVQRRAESSRRSAVRAQ
jgi:hypothetical protein